MYCTGYETQGVLDYTMFVSEIFWQTKGIFLSKDSTLELTMVSVFWILKVLRLSMKGSDLRTYDAAFSAKC